MLPSMCRVVYVMKGYVVSTALGIKVTL